MKTILHIIAAACIVFSTSCAVYVAPSVPNSSGLTDTTAQKKFAVGWTDTVISTNFSPTYHLLSRSYHLHNGGVFVTRLAMVLR